MQLVTEIGTLHGSLTRQPDSRYAVTNVIWDFMNGSFDGEELPMPN